MSNQKRKQKLLTRKEVAERLRLSEGTLAKWASLKVKKLPYFLIGRRARYDLNELEAFIESQKHGSDERNGGSSD